MSELSGSKEAAGEPGRDGLGRVTPEEPKDKESNEAGAPRKR